MDVPLIVAGVLFVCWPLQYQRSMRRIEQRMAARGADAERFRRHMDRRSIKLGLIVAPIAGVAVVVWGIAGG